MPIINISIFLIKEICSAILNAQKHIENHHNCAATALVGAGFFLQ